MKVEIPQSAFIGTCGEGFLISAWQGGGSGSLLCFCYYYSGWKEQGCLVVVPLLTSAYSTVWRDSCNCWMVVKTLIVHWDSSETYPSGEKRRGPLLSPGGQTVQASHVESMDTVSDRGGLLPPRRNESSASQLALLWKGRSLISALGLCYHGWCCNLFFLWGLSGVEWLLSKTFLSCKVALFLVLCLREQAFQEGLFFFF